MRRRNTAERLLGNDRQIVAATIGLMIAVSVTFLLAGGGTGMDTFAMTTETGPFGALIARTPDAIRPAVWTPGYAGVIFLMWLLMMVAMMLPTAAPVILLYGALHPAGNARASLKFLAGYLTVWAGFSALATVLQGSLAAAGLVSPMYMTLATTVLGGIVLIGAGIYQLTPLKAACLSSCRGPVETLTGYRSKGHTAAFGIGLRHGAQCLGCCWALMALLFVGGVMNLVWILGLAAIVAVEKLSPWGDRLARLLGAGLVAAGLALLVRGVGAG